MRSIRLDDYPSGNPGWDIRQSREDVAKALAVFESHGVPYLFGVTPAHLDGSDFEFLNAHVKTGFVVMHGFTHLLEYQPWSKIVDTWPLGGEFMGLSAEMVRRRYNYCHRMLSGQVKRYDPQHFIAPFNCYTQEALDGISGSGVRFWHTCDKEWDAYGYGSMEYHGMQPVISKFQVTYDYAHKVINHLDDPSQLTLHWIFDRGVEGWVDHYRRLCELITQKGSEP